MTWARSICFILLGAFVSAPGAVLASSYDACIATAVKEPLRALTLVDELRSAGDEDAAVHCQAIALFEQGEYASSANLFDQLALGAPDDAIKADIILQAAIARQAAGELREALDRAVTASGLDPKNPEPWLIVAEVQSARENHSEALGALGFAEALLDDAGRAEVLVLKARLQRRSDDLNGARFSLIEALEDNPGNTAALLELGVLFFEAGDDQNAALVWEDLEKVAPDSHDGQQASLYLRRLKELTQTGE